MQNNKLSKTHEVFCQSVVNGLSFVESYIKAFPKAEKWKREVAQNRGCEFAKKPHIAERINELRQAMQEKAKKKFEWDKDKSVKVLASIALNTDYRESARVSAVKAINELLGLNAPTTSKIDHTSEDGSMTPKPVVDVTKLSDSALEELFNARIEK